MDGIGGYGLAFTLLAGIPIALAVPAFFILQRLNPKSGHFREWGLAYLSLTLAIVFGALDMNIHAGPAPNLGAARAIPLVLLGLFYYFHALGSLRYVKFAQAEPLAATVSFLAVGALALVTSLSPVHGLTLSSIIQMAVVFWEGAILRREGPLGRAYFYMSVLRGTLSLLRPMALESEPGLYAYTAGVLCVNVLSVMVLILLALESEHAKVRRANKQLEISNALITYQAESLEGVARDLSEQRLRAVRAEDARKAFLSNMNHEFRNPLNAVIGFSSATMISPGLSEAVKKNLNHIFEAGTQILRHFEKLAEIRDLDLQTTKTSDLLNVEELMSALQTYSAGHPLGDLVTIRLEDSREVEAVCGAKSQIEGALRQLLDNAILYAPAGSSITVSCRLKGEAEAVIEIADRGPGMDANINLEHPEAFVRGISYAGFSKPGLGVGLFIARNLAELNGARLSHRANPGGGTIASLTLTAVARSPAWAAAVAVNDPWSPVRH